MERRERSRKDAPDHMAKNRKVDCVQHGSPRDETSISDTHGLRGEHDHARELRNTYGKFLECLNGGHSKKSRNQEGLPDGLRASDHQRDGINRLRHQSRHSKRAMGGKIMPVNRDSKDSLATLAACYTLSSPSASAASTGKPSKKTTQPAKHHRLAIPRRRRPTGRMRSSSRTRKCN